VDWISVSLMAYSHYKPIATRADAIRWIRGAGYNLRGTGTKSAAQLIGLAMRLRAEADKKAGEGV